MASGSCVEDNGAVVHGLDLWEGAEEEEREGLGTDFGTWGTVGSKRSVPLFIRIINGCMPASRMVLAEPLIERNMRNQKTEGIDNSTMQPVHQSGACPTMWL